MGIVRKCAICILAEDSGKLRVPEPTKFWGHLLQGKDRLGDPLLSPWLSSAPWPEAAGVLGVTWEVLTSKSLSEASSKGKL